MAKYFLNSHPSLCRLSSALGKEPDPPQDSKRTSDQVIHVEVGSWPECWKAETTFFCFASPDTTLTRSTLPPEYHPFLGVGMWDPVCSQPSLPPPLQLWLYFLYFASQYVDTWPFHKCKITSMTMSATSFRAITEVHMQGRLPWSVKQVRLQQISLNNSFSIKSLPRNKDTLLNSETPAINCQSLRVHWTPPLCHHRAHKTSEIIWSITCWQ